MINHTFANNGFTWYKPQLINLGLWMGSFSRAARVIFYFYIYIYSLYKNTANQQFYRYKSTHSKTNSKFKL